MNAQSNHRKMLLLCAVQLLAVVQAGCGKLPDSHGVHAASGPGPADALVAELLKDHGEKNVVTDAVGVGVAGNKTRIRTSLYGSNKQGAGYSAETEFRITLPSGAEVVEYIAGVGDTERKAIDDCAVNFALTTFHPIYKCFINPTDSHQLVHSLKMADGSVREVALGDLYCRDQKDRHGIDLKKMQAEIKDLVTTLSPSTGAHWLKVVYGDSGSKAITVSATLDNNESADLTARLKALPWPHTGSFYMVKEFIIIK
jgi:hypothetical protein